MRALVQRLLALGVGFIGLSITLIGSANAVAAAEPKVERKNDPKAISGGQQDLSLVTKRIEAEPNNPRLYLARAALYVERGALDKALNDCDQALKLDPRMFAAWQARGVIHFKLAQIEQSISDFDQFIKLLPDRTPYHWQRGISYYYAKRFEDGRKQFELHQTVNPNDVENAVWHFLCVTRSAGLEKARESLIPIKDDARVPMMQIHALFAGKAQPEDVLKAASAGEAGAELQRRLFFAHLYLGLYYEATGDERQALQHMTKAAFHYGGSDYMSDVARVHVKLRASKADGEERSLRK